MRSLKIAFPVLLLVGLLTGPAFGQNLFLDYGRKAPASFSPSDPWERGYVFRNQTGHGGLFYNCDGQEEKRHLPWIHWCGPTPERPCIENLVKDWRCQVSEVKQRVRWGKGCDVPHYDVPWLPSSRYGYQQFAEPGTGGEMNSAPEAAPEEAPIIRAADASEAAEEVPVRKGILR